MTGDLDFHAAKAMLLWQMELGADEAIGEVPVNRYAVAEAAARPAVVPPAAVSVAEPAGPQGADDSVSSRGRWPEARPTCRRSGMRLRPMTGAS
jgi:uracil-DNA glycosylase